jgi:glucosamine-6-phosphate deaminase
VSATECIVYEGKVRTVSGIKVFLGGIGEDRHITFNELGSSLVLRTRIKLPVT